MALDKPMRAFGVFSSYQDKEGGSATFLAEAALTKVKADDFRIEQVSLIARQPEGRILDKPLPIIKPKKELISA